MIFANSISHTNHLPSTGLINNYIISGNLITITVMVHKFIISKKSVNFEIHVDGKVEVKPLTENVFSKETIEVLARAHQAFFKGYLLRNKEQDLLSAAIRYFKNNGFEIKDKTGNTEPE